MASAVSHPPAFDLHSLPESTKLKQYYVGKQLQDIDGPAVVLDAAVVVRNCWRMLDTAEQLGFGFRAHVKTHKTVEVTKLQVGQGTGPVKLVVSTIIEAELLLPYLKECKAHGRDVNVLYGVPPSNSSIPRLQRIQDILGPDSVSFLIDHPAQVDKLTSGAPGDDKPISVFIKIDAGAHRAGVTPQSTQMLDLMNKIKESARPVKVVGFYSHHGSSYASNSPNEALEYLMKEIESTSEAVERAKKMGISTGMVTVSVGATPSAASARLFLRDSSSIQRLRKMVNGLQHHYDIEIHAGVYPFLDLQQVATYAQSDKLDKDTTVSTQDIGIRVLAEVLSTYAERDEPEILVGAGSLALGREPCKSYGGWGIVAPTAWAKGTLKSTYNWNGGNGWILGRISQEHGILTWQGKKDDMQSLNIGQNVLIWPNHACISGAGFDWYLVVDSADGEGGTQIKDVWIRCRGW